jgi:hypothetical protein
MPTTFIWLRMGMHAILTLLEMGSLVASHRLAPMDSSNSTLSLPVPFKESCETSITADDKLA